MMANQANPFDQFDAPASAASAATSANPFDQFDQAPLPAGQLPTVTVSPTADDYRSSGSSVPANLRTGNESYFQQLNDQGNDVGDAFAHAVGNIGTNAVQLVGHGITGLANAVLPEGNSVRQALNATGQNFDAGVHRDEQAYQAAVPNSPSAYAGAAIGNVLPWTFGGGALESVGNAARIIPEGAGMLGRIGAGANNVLSSAAQGAAVGAASQPVTDGGQDYAHEKLGQALTGAALGGAVPVVTGAAGGIKNALVNVMSPETVAANALGRSLNATPETLNALSNYQSVVPGTTPTTAQVLATPRAVMVEKAAANNPAFKEQLVQNQNTNNAAHLDVLHNMAGFGPLGDDAPLNSAIAARKAATQPFIDENLSQSTPAIRWNNAAQPIDDALSHNMIQNDNYRALAGAKKIVQDVRSGALQEDDALAQLSQLGEQTTQNSPAFKAINSSMQAVNQGMIDPSSILKSIATTRNATSIGQNPTVQGALGQISNQIQAAKNINGLVPATLLDGIRQNSARILQANHVPNQLIGSQEEAGIAPIKQAITSTLTKNVPGYMDYLANYAKGSQPINDMQAARNILAPSNAGALGSDGSPVLTLAQVNRGLTASGKARYGMSPQAQAQVEAVRNNLQQQSISNAIKSPGSDTNYNAQAQGWLGQQVLGKNLQGTGAGARLGSAVIGALFGSHFGWEGGLAGAAAGGAVNRAANFLNERIMAPYQKGLLNPDVARGMIAKYLSQNQAQAPSLLQQNPGWRALLTGQSQNAPAAQNVGVP